jgi:hypothetical protein
VGSWVTNRVTSGDRCRPLRRHWSRGAIALVAFAALAATGCLTQQQQAEARQIALGDHRFSALLDDHPYEVVEVREPENEDLRELGYAVVEIAFDASFPTEVYPADVCDIGGHDGLVTGVRWLVGLESDEVAAVTPVWGSASCGDGW